MGKEFFAAEPAPALHHALLKDGMARAVHLMRIDIDTEIALIRIDLDALDGAELDLPPGDLRRDGAGESCGIKLRIMAENSVFIEGLSPVAVQIGRDAGQTRNAVMQSDQRGIIALDRCHPLREHVA